jgi:hypothetical protein
LVPVVGARWLVPVFTYFAGGWCRCSLKVVGAGVHLFSKVVKGGWCRCSLIFNAGQYLSDESNE